jgi:two-component system heavy metal sensor histidine kinase CusS
MRLPGSIGMRLAVWFALASALVLGAIGIYLYRSLVREIAWRDDTALIGRVDRMRTLLDDSAGIDALRSRPQLYANMLGNRDNVLWVIDGAGRRLIEINPARLPLPVLPAGRAIRLTDAAQGPAARLAWVDVAHGGQPFRLVAGKALAERDQMLGNYRRTLGGALALGVGLSFTLAWLIGRAGLRPVRRLADRAAAIDVRRLHERIGGHDGDLPETHELRTLTRALDGMLARLGDGFAQLSRFSEDLAHEMRTPLNNLMGQTQQGLRKPRSPQEYQDLLASNLEEYERLARMIDSMLFLARSEQNGTAIVREDISLADMAARLADYFDGMAQERGIVFALQAGGTLQADRALVQRAMANLLANALRYGAPDSTVTIAAAAHGGGAELAVHNTGEPIPVHHLPRLFERFYRADPSRSAPGDSGGLGLAIVRSIMDSHGGTVDVSSGTDGTRFTLRFPAMAVEPSAQNCSAVTGLPNR